MLRRITPHEVRLGMYVQGFEGSWTSHPFWRSKFLLTQPDDVERVRDSAVRAVIIDTGKGLDATVPVAPAEPKSLRERFAEPGLTIDLGPVARRAAAERRRPAAAPLRRRPAPAPVAAEGACGVAAEYGRATRIVEKSRRAVMATFAEARLGKAVQGARLAPLVDQITASVERNGSAMLGIARLKTQHDYTYMHSVAVCTMMIHLARHMKLDDAEVRAAGLAGLLHDVGKMAVPIELLDKRGPLTDEEFAIIKTHPVRGAALLRDSPDIAASAVDVCLHHHERYDGQGYPDGLLGDATSQLARMAAICDVYDAVTSDRAYKIAWSPADALRRMAGWEGHFDPAIFRAFSESIGIYPVGGLVRLQSQTLAVIVGENADDPLHPPVRAFFDAASRRALFARPVRTEIDPIVGMERPADWQLKGWKALQLRMIAESAA